MAGPVICCQFYICCQDIVFCIDIKSAAPALLLFHKPFDVYGLIMSTNWSDNARSYQGSLEATLEASAWFTCLRSLLVFPAVEAQDVEMFKIRERKMGLSP